MTQIDARILIVDDDKEVQGVLKRAAATAGYELVQAFDGSNGLALATEGKFDLIVLDIEMPALDGRDVLSRLRQNPNTANVPVLVYSGRNHQTDRRVVYELGADDHIDKPFSAALLMSKIRRMIEKARESSAKSSL
jgi:DNA-binding response OmpR family regulator